MLTAFGFKGSEVQGCILSSESILSLTLNVEPVNGYQYTSVA